MKLRTDSQRRLYGRDLLKADTIYEAETDGAGRITLVELAPKQAPRLVGKLVRKEGSLVLDAPGVTVDPEAIARAVREERDR